MTSRLDLEGHSSYRLAGSWSLPEGFPLILPGAPCVESGLYSRLENPYLQLEYLQSNLH